MSVTRNKILQASALAVLLCAVEKKTCSVCLGSKEVRVSTWTPDGKPIETHETCWRCSGTGRETP